MKKISLAATVAVLGISTLIAAGNAQACMPGMGGSSSCASANGGKNSPQSCPTAAESGKAQDKANQSCNLINPELVSAAGEVATSGMQMAAKVMRAISLEVDRRMAPSDPF